MAESESATGKAIAAKVGKKEALTPEEVAIYEKVVGKKYSGPVRARTVDELMEESAVLEKRLSSASSGSDSSAEWARLAKLKAEAKEAALVEFVRTKEYDPKGEKDLPRLKALATVAGKLDEYYATYEPGSVAGAKATLKAAATPPKAPIPMEGGALPPKPVPVAPVVAPATGIRPQPMAAPMPSKAGPIQGEAMPTVPGMPISTMPMVKPPPPVMGATPTGEGAQAAGESAPEARAFWDYLQKIQGKGDLVAENPMYTKAFDDATPDEKARLMKENPEYFKKFRSEIGGLLPEPGTKDTGTDMGQNLGGRPKGPKGPDVAKPMPDAPEGVIEKAAGVPDWLLRIGEVLQAGAAGAAGNMDLDKTAYGRRVSKETEEAKRKEENAFYERMKALDFDFQARAAADAAAREADLAKWQAERAAQLQREGIAADVAMAKAAEEAANWRTKYSTDASAKAAKKRPWARLGACPR